VFRAANAASCLPRLVLLARNSYLVLSSGSRRTSIPLSQVSSWSRGEWIASADSQDGKVFGHQDNSRMDSGSLRVSVTGIKDCAVLLNAKCAPRIPKVDSLHVLDTRRSVHNPKPSTHITTVSIIAAD